MLKLFYCLLTTNCFHSIENLVGGTLHVSLLRLSRLMRHCGILISAIILQINPQKLLAHYLANRAFYERRKDRSNFAQRLTNERIHALFLEFELRNEEIRKKLENEPATFLIS